MSSRSSIMVAGLASSTTKINASMNTSGGDKKQGIPSYVAREHWVSRSIKSKANGTISGRNTIFKMNQLGGVSSSSFKSSMNNYANTDSVSYTPKNQEDLHHAKAILLTCMDFRLIDDIVYKMNALGYLNEYDEFILAGASLGYNGIPGYTWAPAFEDHINLAIQLHDISEIIIIDHLHCGAYRLVYTPQQLENDGEFNLHVKNLNIAKNTLQSKYNLTVKLFIIDIEGNVLTPI